MQPSDLSARVAGRYEILGKMGEGGMGAIYKVRHRLLDVVRVAKVLQPQFVGRRDWQKRFLREAKMASRLKHRSLAQLHDFDLDPARGAWMIMELIDGCDLRNVLRHNGPPSVAMALEIGRQSLSAFEYLHSNDLVHRDVSPDNLMLTRGHDGGPEIKLIDLGIAKRVGAGELTSMTADFVGKYRYSSPEQLDASSEVDHRSDLYSLGLVLYQLLTGAYPFRGHTPQELASAHWFQEPLPFDETDPDGRIPDALRAALLRSLEKDPARRWTTAAEFAAALDDGAPPDGSALAQEIDEILDTTRRAMPPEDHESGGSTQQHLDRVFGGESAPFATATEPTEATPLDAERGREAARRVARAKAEMLVGHWESARAQLAAALRLEPAHEEARKALAEVEKDIEREAQIEATAELIRRHLEDGELTRAGRALTRAAAELGEAEALAALRRELDGLLAERASDLEGLLATARRQGEAGDLEPALASITRALEIEPQSDEARRLQSELRAGLARRAKIAETIEHLEERLAAADFAAIDRILRAARRDLGDAPMLLDFGRRAERRRERAARDLVARARQRLAASEWSEAGELLRQALDLSPEYDEALELAMHVRDEHRKATGLADAHGTIEALLATSKLDQARSRLAQAVSDFGWAAPLSELERRLEERVAQRDEEIARLLASAEELGRQGDLTQALVVARQAASLGGDSLTPGSYVADLEAAIERRRALEEVARGCRSLIARGDLEAATRSLEEARAEHGGDALLDGLAAEIDHSRRRSVERQAGERLARAEKLAVEERWQDAAAELRRVLELAPGRREAERLLRRAEQEIERQAGARQAAEELRRLIEAGRVEQATRRLEEAEARFGDGAGWTEVRRTLQQSVERRRRIDEHLEAADRLRGEGSYRQAILEVQKARKLGPVADAEALVEELRRLERQSRAVGKVAGAVHRAIQRGDLKRAEALLARAEEAHPGAEPLRALRAEITRQTIAEKNEWLGERVAEASRELEAGRLGPALAAVQAVIEVDPGRQEARELMTRIERRIEQQRAGRREVDKLARGIDEQRLERTHPPGGREPAGARRWAAPAAAAAVLLAAAAVAWKVAWFSGGLEIAPFPPTPDLAIWVDAADSGLVAPATLPLRGRRGTRREVRLVRAGETVATERFELGDELPERWSPRLPARRLIVSQPAGARVEVDGRALAEPTPTLVELDPDPDGEHRVRLELEGHQPRETTLRLADWPDPLRLELVPLARPGTLVVRAPYPVELRIAGRTESGRLLRVELEPGSYDAALTSRALFFSRRARVRIAAGETRELSSFPAVAGVWVLSVPGNAELAIDRRSVGALPREVRLVAGTHLFEFTWPDRSFAEEVEIAPDSRQVSSDATRIVVE